MKILKSTVGRKLLMAATGLLMTGFVILHLLGNSSVFMGPDGINAYAAALRKFGPVLWIFRTVMLALFALHVFFGIILTIENNAAKPEGYAVRKHLRTTFAARNMIWTGAATGAFLIYHILHFTIQVTNPGISAHQNADIMGRPDVFHMIVLSFRKFLISLAYIAGLSALALHLSHGIQSFIQTFGLNNDRTLAVTIKVGTVTALVLFLGYASIPVLILAGVLRG